MQPWSLLNSLLSFYAGIGPLQLDVMLVVFMVMTYFLPSAQVYDGDSSDAPVLMKSACGSSLPAEIRGTANKLFIEYVVDGRADSSNGFKAFLYALPPGQSVLSHIYCILPCAPRQACGRQWVSRILGCINLPIFMNCLKYSCSHG